MATPAKILRRIPAVDQIIQRPDLMKLCSEYPRHLVLEELQRQLAAVRRSILENGLEEKELDERLAGLAPELRERLERRLTPSLQKVINATGVLIHTNAGRAPLAESIAEQVKQISGSYSNLEYDIERRARGQRDQHLESRLTRLLGCEAATVCNNNAAALFLILNTMAAGRKVLVSRGELVEIGGSFRIPDIMEKSQALLTEVGTTNKTRISDYRKAIDEETALILRVHPSNFRIVGFTAKPSLAELVSLAREKGLPLVEDIGSGHLFESNRECLRNEPSAQFSLRAGTDLVCFSGDKLLGGPQSGLIVGASRWVKLIRKNPLMRVLRVDKSTYLGLDLTLREYETGTFESVIPIHRMMSLSPKEIEQRCRQLVKKVENSRIQLEVVQGFSVVGGGSAPEESLPTHLIRVNSPFLSAEEVERSLRCRNLPILCRIEGDAVLLDLRTVFPAEDKDVALSLREVGN